MSFFCTVAVVSDVFKVGGVHSRSYVQRQRKYVCKICKSGQFKIEIGIHVYGRNRICILEKYAGEHLGHCQRQHLDYERYLMGIYNCHAVYLENSR